MKLGWVSIFFAILCIGYANCASYTKQSASQGKRTETLDDDGKYILAWEVDGDTITFEVEVETTGYVGFGISPFGSMTGADIFIAGVGEDGKPYSTVRK
jgi:hypothetical protein